MLLTPMIPTRSKTLLLKAKLLREAVFAAVGADDRETEALVEEEPPGEPPQVLGLDSVDPLDDVVDGVDALEQQLLRAEPGGDAPRVFQAQEHPPFPELLGPI